MRQFLLLFAAMAYNAASHAHHSTAMFDADKKVTLDATVKELQWTNPHAWLQLVVRDAGGADVEWSVEMGNPAAMIREGWKSNALRPGDKVQVTISPLRNGGHGGNLISVTRDDGTIVGRKGP
jgi:Family of unknown function (DUF6152)